MTADEDLFREWQIGSAAALEILVRRYHAPLVAHLYRMVGDAHLAEDLTQETFVRLVRDANAYRYPRPFWPWLYTIARHLALSYHASAYYRHVELRAEVPETVAPDPDPADWLEHWEELHGLQTALLHLSFEQREVLSLRFGQEMSVKEIAALLRIPAGTVKSRTFTALRLLRRYLEQETPSSVDEQGDSYRG